MRRLRTGFPVWTSIPQNKEKQPGCQQSKGQSGGRASAAKLDGELRPTNSAGEADSGFTHTCAHQVPSAAAAACTVAPSTGLPGRHCRCVVEVQLRSQKRRSFLNKHIYWTLCRTVLLHGSPLSSTEVPPALSPSTLGPPPRVCSGGSGGNGKDTAKTQRLSTGS